MKLIRRKQSPTTFERVVKVVGLGAKGLAAQRIARRGFRGYKFTKRAVPLAGLGALFAVIAKKAKGGGGGSPPSYSAPTSPPTATPAPDVTAPAEGKEAAAPGLGDESGTDDAGNATDDAPPADASGTDETLDVEAPNQSTPPPPEKAAKK